MQVSVSAAKSWLELAPRSRLSVYGGPRDTLDAMARAALGLRGEQSALVNRFKSEVTKFIQPKDYLGELLAIRNVLLQPNPKTGQALIRYTNDPRHVELVKDPQRIVEEIMYLKAAECDCDESATFVAALALQLGRVVQFVALGFGGGTQLTHVGTRAQEPKSGRWIWLDSVAGPRESEAARKATRVVFRDLD